MSYDMLQLRADKIEKMRLNGVEPYPDRFEQTHSLEEASRLPDDTFDVKIAGRVTAIRHIGKLIFAVLKSVEGKLQLLLKRDEIGDEPFSRFLELFDVGDFVGAEGVMFTTVSGERTLRVHRYRCLGKSLRPLPEKWHGLTNVELRYRQRYLDLVMNDETNRRLLLRTKIIGHLRAFMEQNGFIEVDTPILQPNASGALARPFKTHHHALDAEMHLRIAPETYLKRLIAGGFTRVFEVAKCFRNEGVSPQHLQEFTMVEGYAAYWNYEDTMSLIRNMLLYILEQTTGETRFETAGEVIDFARPWQTVSFRDLILSHTGIDIDLFADAKQLYAETVRRGIKLDHDRAQALGRGNLIDLLYKKTCRPNVIQPTFLVHHPIDLSPLARASDSDPKLTDRFQLVINGAEVVNAYSELVDPIEQRRRLEEQARYKQGGDEEAMDLDEEYVLAMEHGMPPISGWGMGIERLLMLMTDCDNIKDCVFFPLVKRSEGSYREELE